MKLYVVSKDDALRFFDFTYRGTIFNTVSALLFNLHAVAHCLGSPLNSFSCHVRMSNTCRAGSYTQNQALCLALKLFLIFSFLLIYTTQFCHNLSRRGSFHYSRNELVVKHSTRQLSE
ncbi:Uncharacterised protein [Mycobacteroides abscessus subsp. abscessus]|nr:Uncharacterised protein [Mycobacteroides abscessus subsp. abscessus]